MNESMHDSRKTSSWIPWLAMLFAWSSANASALAQPKAQSGKPDQGFSPISLGAQVRVIPQSGFVELTIGSETKKFGVSIMHNEGWVAPKDPIGPPFTFRNADADRIELVYDIPGNRRFHLKVTAIHGTPGAVIAGELENLGKSPVVEYFYWYWNTCSPRCLTPKGELALTTTDWAQYDSTSWKYFPEKGGKGWVLVSEDVVGRAAGENAMGVLRPIEQFQETAPGKSYRCGFAASWVDGAAAGADAFSDKVAKFTRGKKDDGADVDWGPAAPAWARTPIAGGYYRPYSSDEWANFWSNEVINTRLKPFPWVIGSTPNPEILTRFHKAGGKLLHYVCFVEMLDTVRQVQGGGIVYPEWRESILNEERDLARHPNWVAIGENGKPQRSLFGIQMNHPGLMNVCFHDPAFKATALRQIKRLLELGYDGVFVDLCFSTPECYGDKFAGHKHVPGKTNTDMYFECLDAIYKTVKDFDKDRLVVMNGALDSNFKRADAVMWESAIYAPDKATRLQSRAELVVRGRKYARAVKCGKVLFQLSYCGGKAGDSWKRLLFTYSYARTFGFTWSDYTEYFDINQQQALRLYTLDLGKPLADGLELKNGVWRRDFEKGTVLWNADTTELSTIIEVEAEGTVTNFADGSACNVKDRRLAVSMPAESGSILLYKRASTKRVVWHTKCAIAVLAASRPSYTRPEVQPAIRSSPARPGSPSKRPWG